MAQTFLTLFSRFRAPEDAVFCARLSALGQTPKPRRLRSRAGVSPFRFVAARSF